MKMYKKSELELVDGLLLAKDGTVVSPVGNVVRQANELDTLVQKAIYLQAQPEATPIPSLDGFERVSNFNLKYKLTADTPTFDKRTEEAVKFMNELDDLSRVEVVNEFLEKYSELIRFADAEQVVCSEAEAPEVFDTPTIGNPLELTPELIIKSVGIIHGIAKVPDRFVEDEDE